MNLLNPRLTLTATLLCLPFTVCQAAPSIDMDAFDKALTQWVNPVDSNGDGGLSRDELRTMQRKIEGSRGFFGSFSPSPLDVLVQSFAELDSNRDGKLTASEISDAMNARFKRADSTGKNALSLSDAQRGMPYVASVYRDIDTAKRSALTLQQVRDYLASQLAQGAAQLAHLR